MLVVLALLLGIMSALLPRHQAEAITPTYYYLPDLTFTATSVHFDGEAAPWIGFTVKNQGAIDAAPFNVVVRDRNGVVVATKRINGLAAGASVSTSVATSGGSVSIRCVAPYALMVDSSRELNERNESNNFATACIG